MAAFHTVEDVAVRLNLHPRTVHRMIREGRLRATRIGKSYRILDADLNAFVGLEPEDSPPPAPPRATGIVDIPVISAAEADRLTVATQAMLLSRGQDEAMHFTASHDAAHGLLRFIATGSPVDVAALLEGVAYLVKGVR
ncbi:helix-turn-helix domain-containing protein [Luteibacter anthropi]|uniref:Helix-turn-helix domain-containing protein n=1 Tax=Luteibacter anthropi TaxID=564369 RepID=A0A7X5UCA0_9GAMM|nr:helix-turn-helix domain-containing protein [Luteibacter anthropi]